MHTFDNSGGGSRSIVRSCLNVMLISVALMLTGCIAVPAYVQDEFEPGESPTNVYEIEVREE